MKLLFPLLYFICSVFSAEAQQLTQRDYRAYFAAHQAEGSFLLLDVAANRFTAYNLARCRQGFLPASTFKIPNTLIGLETGCLRDTSEVCHWDGVVRERVEWNRDMSYAQALRLSCVPCYQQLARWVGAVRYQQWMPRLRYGKIKVSPSTVDNFWLEGTSRITSFEQVDFLRRLQAGGLPVSARSQTLTKAALAQEHGRGWVIRAKTGLIASSAQTFGWWVGWVEQRGRIYVFALNMEPLQHAAAGPSFAADRLLIAKQILRKEFGLL